MNSGVENSLPINNDPTPEKIEFNSPPPSGLTCVSCHEKIQNTYFDINGKVFCPSCKNNVEAALYEGSQAQRVLLAVASGTGSALLGAGLYYEIEKLTGYQFGLIAILVGFMVGASVRWGSKGRGGLGYQLLAMFLTYNALILTYLPYLLDVYANKFTPEPIASSLPPSSFSLNTVQEQPVLAGKSQTIRGAVEAPTETPSEGSIPVPPPNPASSMNASPDTISSTGSLTTTSISAGTDAITPFPAKPEASPGPAALPPNLITPVATPRPAPPKPKTFSLSDNIVSWGRILLLAYLLPFLSGVKSIVGLFIIGTGLYVTWKINSKPRFIIKGPYQSNPPKTP